MARRSGAARAATGRRSGRAGPGGPAPGALTCDLWYTLAYFRPRERDAHVRRRQAAWAEPLVRSGMDRGRAMGHVLALVAWGRRHEAAGWTPTIPDQVRWLARRTGVPARRFGGVADAVDASLAATRVLPAPGALAVLDDLRDRGVRIGLVSNILFESGRATRALLDRLGLAARLDEVVLSCEVPWAKPDPRTFLRCLRGLRAAPHRSVHVGDLAFDVVGARRAGMRPILYTGLHRYEDILPSLGPGRLRPVRIDRWRSLPRRLDGLGTGPADRGRARRSVPASRSG